MIGRLLHLLVIIFRSNNTKMYYYKNIIINSENGCVQAFVNSKMAQRYNARLGNCLQNGCSNYRGSLTIPHCCRIQGFSCD